MSTTTVSQFLTATAEQASWVASGWSEAAQRYSRWVTEQSATRVLTETEKVNRLATELGTGFRDAANNATAWSQAARDAGRTGIADIMDKYAGKYAGQADKLLNQMLDQRANLNLLAAEAWSGTQQAQKMLGGGFGHAIGPAFDAAQMADGVIIWATTGDNAKFGGAAMGVFLSYTFGIGAAAASPIVPLVRV